MRKKSENSNKEIDLKRDITNLIMGGFIIFFVTLIFFYPNNRYILTAAFILGGVFNIRNGIYNRKKMKSIISIYLLFTGILMILGAFFVLFAARIG